MCALPPRRRRQNPVAELEFGPAVAGKFLIIDETVRALCCFGSKDGKFGCLVNAGRDWRRERGGLCILLAPEFTMLARITYMTLFHDSLLCFFLYSFLELDVRPC